MQKNEIFEILRLNEAEFTTAVQKKAREQYRKSSNVLFGAAMLGFSNICRCNCLYCGMRGAGKIPRYRLSPDEILASMRRAKEDGYTRAFLISGEDHGFGFENLLKVVQGIRDMGFSLSLASGEFSRSEFKELADAGVKEYVAKFEMSQKDVFERLNPSTTYERRMQAIEDVKASGMMLASGNIVGYPGQTQEMLAEDILLMLKLGISWAPVIPYMPAKGTPLALEGGRGSLLDNQKEIAILRLALPEIRITAQQPGPDLSKGLADDEGNLMAIEAGANFLFSDLLPQAQAANFSVVDDRNIKTTGHLLRMAEMTGMKLER